MQLPEKCRHPRSCASPSPTRSLLTSLHPFLVHLPIFVSLSLFLANWPADRRPRSCGRHNTGALVICPFNASFWRHSLGHSVSAAEILYLAYKRNSISLPYLAFMTRSPGTSKPSRLYLSQCLRHTVADFSRAQYINSQIVMCISFIYKIIS